MVRAEKFEESFAKKHGAHLYETGNNIIGWRFWSWFRIAHPFGILGTKRARVGANCFLHQCVTIGTNENEEGAPRNRR